MSLFVGLPVEAEWQLAVDLVGNDGLGAAILKPLPQRSAVVGLIAQKLLGRLGSADDAFSQRTIVRLAATQEDGKKTAPSIRDCVDLRIAPAA